MPPTIEIRLILLSESRSTNGMELIILEDTSSGIDSAVDTPLRTYISQVESANHIGTEGLSLVGLTPIDVWSAWE